MAVQRERSSLPVTSPKTLAVPGGTGVEIKRKPNKELCQMNFTENEADWAQRSAEIWAQRSEEIEQENLDRSTDEEDTENGL